MHTRIAQVISDLGMKKVAFAKRLGLSQPFVSELCSGKSKPSDRTISDICREFGVDEVWLRTGVGEPFHKPSREEELGTLVASLLRDRPESFRTRLITALLRFDPASPEWEVLEHIYNSIAEEKPER